MHAPHNSATTANATAGNPLVALARWFDAGQEPKCDGKEPECPGGHGWPRGALGGHGWPRKAPGLTEHDDDRIDWLRVVPFIAMHLACLGVCWVGISAFAVWTALLLYALRMFALTGFYHRYFSHKAFRTSRPVQFLFALIGAACVQRGPLWWAAHHRDHHRHADTEHDIHSPLRHGFLWSHMGWFLTPRAFRTRWEAIGDLQRYRELRWLDRYDIAVPVLLAVALFFLGRRVGAAFPASGTSGAQLLVWGFFVSTVVLFHATVTINSLAHRFGTRRFATRDNSRNNWLLALLTFGEGWHNNHHHFPGSARQGFRWWEIDLTYYVLRVLAACGLIWDLKPLPASLVRSPQGRNRLKNAASEGRLRVGGAQEPECTQTYMRVSRALLGSHASRRERTPAPLARAGSTDGAQAAERSSL